MSIIADDQTVLDQIEVAAIEEMKSYLGRRYDVTAIFAATGTSRSHLVVMYLVDMVTYHISAARTPRDVPQIRKDRYDAAMKWLEDCANGIANPFLPILTDDNGDSKSDLKFGSNPKTEHYY